MGTETVLMEEMSWRQIEQAIAASKKTVILGVGSIEQHGPHLPTGTDTYLGYAMSEGIARELGDALAASTMRPGLAEHHIDFPGTLTLSQETFMQVLMEYCESLSRHGFEDIVLLSSHGGNTDTMVAFMPRIAKALKGTCRVHMLMPNIRERPAEIMEIYAQHDITFPKAGVHSGWGETSLMLAIRPDLVDMQRAEEGRADEGFYSPDEIKYSQIESFVHGVRSQSPNGILGDARGANADAGRKLLAIRIKQAAEEIRKMIAVAKARGA